MEVYKTVIQFNEFLFKWLKSLPLKSGQNVEVIILPEEEKINKNSKKKLKNVLKQQDFFDSGDDKNQWDTIVQQNFAKAYSEDEPEYTINLIKEPNADYERR